MTENFGETATTRFLNTCELMATTKKQLGGGGSAIVPNEKLKASQAILSPFIVGEDEKVDNISISLYGPLSSITIDKNTALGINIAGHQVTLKQSLVQRGIDILSHGSKVELKESGGLSSGVVILGGYTAMVAHTSDTQQKNDSFSNRGLLVLGHGGVVCDDNDLEKQTIDKNDTSFENGLLNTGILVNGNRSYTTLNNGNLGTVITGSGAMVRCLNNAGVMIIPSLRTEACLDSNIEYPLTTEEKNALQNTRAKIVGQGLVLCGIVSEIDDSGKETQKSGFIQGSTLKNLPIELKGYFKLTSDFNLVDKDGTQLVANGKLTNVAKTIAQLEERIAQLEAKQSST